MPVAECAECRTTDNVKLMRITEHETGTVILQINFCEACLMILRDRVGPLKNIRGMNGSERE